MIDEAVFHEHAARTLSALERTLSDADEGLDVDLSADILNIEFVGGGTFVVNSHTAARQLWMAANLEAWHFDLDVQTGRWTDTRGRGELWDVLSAAVSAKLGRAVRLAPGK